MAWLAVGAFILLMIVLIEKERLWSFSFCVGIAIGGYSHYNLDLNWWISIGAALFFWLFIGWVLDELITRNGY